jgi:hypothetical protein
VGERIQSQDTMALRIDRLEEQNRRLKHGALVCVLLLTCAGLMAQTKKRPAAVPPPPPPAPRGPRTVEAEAFILKDADGRVRAELSMAGTGPSLKLRDATGSALVTLSLNDGAPGGPLLLFSDPQHHAALAMSVLEGQGSQLSLTGERPDIQLRAGVTPDGTALELSDKDGFSTTIGNGVQAAKNGQTKKTSAASLALFSKERKVVWSAP